MAEHYELRVLADYLHTGAQALNTWARPTPLAVQGELESHERGEVVYAEVWSPVTALDADEDLLKVIIVADGEELSPYISLNGIRATCMAPPKTRLWSGKLYSFGTPMSNNPLLSTTIKYKQNITVNCLVGPNVAITQDYRVRLWGYVYKEIELPGVFGTMLFPAELRDKVRGRTLHLDKTTRLADGREIHGIPVNGESWLTLPGGKDQSIPKINPFIRYAYNVGVSDGMQGDFFLRYDTQDVLESDENMYFEFDEKDALLIQSIGIKAAANLARTGLRIAGDYHPKGRTSRVALFPTTVGINELNFGHAFPFLPATQPIYHAIPLLARPYLIWNEIGSVIFRDDGTAVGARAVCAALTGIRIEMRG